MHLSSRLVTGNGISFDPRRLDLLFNMKPPLTDAHLKQFMCSL